MKNGELTAWLKDNGFKIILLVAGLVSAWTLLEGTSRMNSARIARAEDRIDTLEETLNRLVILEERQQQNREDILEIKETVKEINIKMDEHLLDR